MKNVIFDLDGTLADCEHRRHHVGGETKNWQAFFDECDRDTVIEPVAQVFRYYSSLPDHRVYILSGRMGNENTLAKTLVWLTDNNLMPFNFIMRKDGDYRTDIEVKREMLDKLGLTPENVVVCFDDRDCVVKAYRDWGFAVFQVAEGDF